MQSCPHQDWETVDLKQCEFYVRTSGTLPGAPGFQSRVAPGEERPYTSLSRALASAYALARKHKAQGDPIKRNVRWGVHRISRPGEAPTFVFVEFVDRSIDPAAVAPSLAPQAVREAAATYNTVSVRLEQTRFKVLRAAADMRNETLPEFLEKAIEHVINGEPAFDAQSRRQIDALEALYSAADDANSPQSVPTPAIMRTAEAGRAFDWLNDEEDVYDERDLKVRYR